VRKAGIATNNWEFDDSTKRVELEAGRPSTPKRRTGQRGDNLIFRLEEKGCWRERKSCREGGTSHEKAENSVADKLGGESISDRGAASERRPARVKKIAS